MAQLLETFANAIENPQPEEDNIVMNSFMTEEDRVSWEKLTEVFDSIDILHVGRDVIKVSKKFKTNHEEDIAILAYVKVLELMVKRAKDVQNIAINPTKGRREPEYSGSMFG
jgi:hypothetical protein|tara:strand:+ start:1284 stop:1619 length:336 start_codon:yes stop_codon:yes gene_type:complete